MATKTALKLADYTVTEAGFGADLGAEKFIDIKCRISGLKLDAAVLVATVRALKYQGGVAQKDLSHENLTALEKGCVNLERHLLNVRQHYGLPCVVAINHFVQDSDAELKLLTSRLEKLGVKAVVARHWADGGAGAEQLARSVVELLQGEPAKMTYVYPDNTTLWDKITAIATKIYGAGEVIAAAKVRKKLDGWNKDYGWMPICMAKTPMSFSSDPALLGAPTGHTVEVREVRLSNGAGFVVAICGNMMTMPGLPKEPSAEKIDIDDEGNVIGLF